MKNKLKFRCGREGCRRIYHLTKTPEHYRTTKICECGGTLYDYSSDRKRNRARTCYCDGVPYPHNKGTLVWCSEHALGPTEQDFIDRHGPQ